MRSAFLAACLVAGLIPFAPLTPLPPPASAQAWPETFEGFPLVPAALSADDARFMRDFPGRVAAFTSGGKRVLMRRIDQATRTLHHAADCYRGLGFETKPLPSLLDGDGARWGRFEAVRGRERVTVRERIVGSDGHSWTDPSSWYWSALMGRSSGPWFAMTVAERSSDAPVR